jgi:hypothetical protein
MPRITIQSVGMGFLLKCVDGKETHLGMLATFNAYYNWSMNSNHQYMDSSHQQKQGANNGDDYLTNSS